METAQNPAPTRTDPAPGPTRDTVASIAAPPDAQETGSGDDEAPEWPDESVEAAMIAEQRERDDAAPPPARAPRPSQNTDTEDDASVPLPKLDALIEKIPSDVRETLDELFRARFTSVQRVSKRALKE